MTEPAPLTSQPVMAALCILAILVAAAALTLGIRRENRQHRPASLAGHSPPSQSLSPEALASVQRLIRAGRKIEAIKSLRQLAGLSLRQAKEAVEAMGSQFQADEPGSANESMGTDALALAVLSRADGESMLSTIKWVREQTGWGLKESKEFVERVLPGPHAQE